MTVDNLKFSEKDLSDAKEMVSFLEEERNYFKNYLVGR